MRIYVWVIKICKNNEASYRYYQNMEGCKNWNKLQAKDGNCALNIFIIKII